MVIRFLITYFLWISVFGSEKKLFGYEQAELISYVIVTYLVSNFVFATRTHDVGSEINEGKLTNYLIRPINYFGFLLSRDLGDKLLNLLFSIVELFILLSILKPPLYLSSTSTILLAVIALLGSVCIYFLVSIILGFIGFWTPEVWGPRFIFFMLIEFMAGTYFPLDILPDNIEKIISLTPFPYFFYFPVKLFLGQLSISSVQSGFSIMLFWLFILFIFMQLIWRKGLRVYSAEGR